jgi:hypothetical protein
MIASSAMALSAGPPDARAGDPPGNRNCTLCHTSFPVNSGLGTLEILGLPETYVPGVLYPLTVSLQDPEPNRLRWGFELTVIKESDLNRAGELEPVNDTFVQESAGDGDERDYLKHRSAGTFPGQPNGATWEITWTAPPFGTGPAHFYAAGNAANNSGTNSGDYIYTINVLVGEAVSSAPEWPAGSVFALDALPNPARGLQEIRFSLPSAATGTLRALDAAGRVVRTLLPSGQMAAGPGSVRWDGQDDAGQPLPAGVYYVRLTVAGTSATHSVIRIR